jgi:ribosomal protein L16/L10AE
MTHQRKRNRERYEIKPRQPGKKSQRGQAELYDQVKKTATFSITPSAIENLRLTAERLGISRSEVIERYCRHLLMNDDPNIVSLIHKFIKQDEG